MTYSERELVFTFAKNEFKVNTKISYPLPVTGSWDSKVNVDDVTTLKIYVNEKHSFIVRNFNVFSNYMPSFNNTAKIEKWRSHCDMTFYQNQLNFAVCCASAGYGVCTQHLNTSHNLLSSFLSFIYRMFHFRILTKFSP